MSCLRIIFPHYTSDCLWEIFITRCLDCFSLCLPSPTLLIYIIYLSLYSCYVKQKLEKSYPNTLMCENPAKNKRRRHFYRFLFHHHNFAPTYTQLVNSLNSLLMLLSEKQNKNAFCECLILLK